MNTIENEEELNMNTTGKKSSGFLHQIKKVVLITASLVLVTFALTAVFAYKFIQDPFDFSKYNASTINNEINNDWVDLENINQIEVQQAQVIFYGSESDKLQYSCRGNSFIKKENTFLIKQARCYVKVPNKKIDIKSFQSQVILVEPSNILTLDIEQSSLKVAEKSSKYEYTYTSRNTDIRGLYSAENGIKINAAFLQSDVSAYEY